MLALYQARGIRGVELNPVESMNCETPYRPKDLLANDALFDYNVSANRARGGAPGAGLLSRFCQRVNRPYRRRKSNTPA